MKAFEKYRHRDHLCYNRRDERTTGTPRAIYQTVTNGRQHMTLYPYHTAETSIAGGDIATLDAIDAKNALHTSEADECEYPESDGKPMADNTDQYRTMVMIKENLETMHRHDPQVFVAGDLLWYPRRYYNTICRAPDVMVVFGRPKGYRGSYKQWEEANIPPQVVFEILSPSNTPDEMINKFVFYEHYGVEEYYIYNPDTNEMEGWIRRGTRLEQVLPIQGWASPRLQIRFDLQRDELDIYMPNGERFMTHAELKDRAERAEQRAHSEYRRAERLAIMLRELGVDPDATE